MDQAMSELFAVQGFQIFVDGMYMAALTDPQPFFSVSAGQGFSIDGPIVLCGRSDLASGRFFEGKIAHFSVFDSPLTNATVSRLETHPPPYHFGQPACFKQILDGQTK